MDKIQIEEESAIIPLAMFNKMKEQIALFEQDLSGKCVRVDRLVGKWDDTSKTYYIPSEWEVAGEIEAFKKTNQNESRQWRDRERDLEKCIRDQTDELRAMREKGMSVGAKIFWAVICFFIGNVVALLLQGA